MGRDAPIRVLQIARHRNGITGTPFHAVIFHDSGEKDGVKLGVVFDDPRCVAVLDVAKLAAGDVEFASNSWRGDYYESALREAVDQRADRPDESIA